ncbi:MAG: hypothetical protein JEY96_19510 [Bacteroidales bacterium]|nr:hypothetical protein [Bacteroidales bacterium]
MTKKQSRNLGFHDVKNKREFWKTFSDEINGEFKIITTVSRDLNKLRWKLIIKESKLLSQKLIQNLYSLNVL